jgi:hypothetical protein
LESRLKHGPGFVAIADPGDVGWSARKILDYVEPEPLAAGQSMLCIVAGTTDYTRRYGMMPVNGTRIIDNPTAIPDKE